MNYYNTTHGQWITAEKTDTQYCFEEEPVSAEQKIIDWS